MDFISLEANVMYKFDKKTRTEYMEMIILPKQYEKIRDKLKKPRFCALDCTINQRRTGGDFKQLVFNKVKKVYF